MPSKFESLLIDLDRQTAGVIRLVENLLERVERMNSDVTHLRERIAKLEKTEEYDGLERRRVDGRLETGDHTFKKLEMEVEMAKRASERAILDVSQLAKRVSVSSGRRFLLWKGILMAIVTAALAVITTMVTNAFTRGGGAP